MLCPNCETQNRNEAKFCDQCGFPLSAASGTKNDDAAISEAIESPGEKECAPSDERVAENEPKQERGPEAEDSAEDATQLIAEAGAEARTPAAAEALYDDGSSDADATALIGHDLAGFDTSSEEFEDRLAKDYEIPVANNRDGETMQMPRVEGEAAQKSKDYLASSTTERKGSGKKALIIVLAILAALAVAAFATYALELWGGKSIPDVVGMTEAEAKSVLEQSGFTSRSEQVKSDNTEGLVVIMDPPAQSRVDEGSEVVIHIATARKVPDVVGKSQKEAKSLLAEEGYVDVKVKKKASDKKEGSVIEVSPKAGTATPSTSTVTITVAQPYTVPDVSGMLLDDAISALEKAGLGYDVAYVSTDSYPEGTIIGTEPAAGTVVEKGSYVVIQITQAWSAQLEDAASAYLAPGSTVDMGGSTFEIESLDEIAYEGGNEVSYSVTAREIAVVFGQTMRAPYTTTLSGTISFTEDGEIASVS